MRLDLESEVGDWWNGLGEWKYDAKALMIVWAMGLSLIAWPLLRDMVWVLSHMFVS